MNHGSLSITHHDSWQSMNLQVRIFTLATKWLSKKQKKLFRWFLPPWHALQGTSIVDVHFYSFGEKTFLIGGNKWTSPGLWVCRCFLLSTSNLKEKRDSWERYLHKEITQVLGHKKKSFVYCNTCKQDLGWVRQGEGKM